MSRLVNNRRDYRMNSNAATFPNNNLYCSYYKVQISGDDKWS